MDKSNSWNWEVLVLTHALGSWDIYRIYSLAAMSINT